MVDEAIKKLISTKIWHLDDEERYAVFREVTEKTELMSGAGLSSRVLASGEPNWITDLSKDKDFSRAAVAKDIGIKGGAAFPVQVGDDVVGLPGAGRRRCRRRARVFFGRAEGPR